MNRSSCPFFLLSAFSAVFCTPVRSVFRTSVCASVAMLLAGCGQDVAVQLPGPDSDTSAWLGGWAGADGAYLQIDPVLETYDQDGLSPSQKHQPPSFALTITAPASPRGHRNVSRLTGYLAGNAIEFRSSDGTLQTIRQTDGSKTLFKQLESELECVSVEPSKDAFCRMDRPFDPDRHYPADNENAFPAYPWTGTWDSATHDATVVIMPAEENPSALEEAPSSRYSIAYSTYDSSRLEWRSYITVGRQVNGKLTYSPENGHIATFTFSVAQAGWHHDCLSGSDGFVLCRR